MNPRIVMGRSPPPMDVPPTGVTWISLVFLAALVSLIFFKDKPNVLFVIKMTVFTATICLTPTLSHRLTREKGRIARIALETVLFVIILISFSWWVFGINAFGAWISYAIALILILEAGGHFVEDYKVSTLNRLTRSPGDYWGGLHGEAEIVERMFHRAAVLYIAVPLGLVTGTIIGLMLGQTTEGIVLFCLQLVLLLESLVLLYFLIFSFLRMSNSLLRAGKISKPSLAVDTTRLIPKVLSAGELFTLQAPLSKLETSEQEKRAFDLAYMVTDLRKVYLYDAIHNVILMGAYAAAVLNLRGITISVWWIIVALAGMSFLFNHLPYVIGQWELHKKVLEKYEGIKRADISEQLKKYAPLYPKSDFIAALVATGSSGGLLYFLLVKFIENIHM